MGILHPDSSYGRLCIYTSTTDIIMLIRELTEAPYQGYGLEGKPEWYDRAVKMKLDNPSITASEIARQVGKNVLPVIYWLTGYTPPGYKMLKRPETKDWPPFKPEDFPLVGNKKYRDGAKPEWYVQAVKMAKAGDSYREISRKLDVGYKAITNWLVKGKKWNTGGIINPDAPFEPGRKGNQLNPRVMNDVQKLLKYPVDNDNIVQYIMGKYDGKTANLVKNMLPGLRQKQNPGTQVIDKTASGLNNPVARPPKTKVTDL